MSYSNSPGDQYARLLQIDAEWGDWTPSGLRDYRALQALIEMKRCEIDKNYFITKYVRVHEDAIDIHCEDVTPKQLPQ